MKKTIQTLLATAALATINGRAHADPAPTNAPWTGSIGAGLTLTRGNSDTTLATLDFNADKKNVLGEWLLGANAAYGKSEGVRNVETAEAKAQYNQIITDKLYYGAKLDALSDVLAGINYRLTFAPLVGYNLIKSTNTTLAVEAGPAAVLQKLGRTTRGYATLRLAERFEYKLSATAKVWESFEYYPEVDKFNDYYWDAELGIEASISKHWSLRSFIDDTYYNVPAAGRLKNDIKLVSGIAYKF